MKKKTVFVGLSGGVDSAVSVALLKKSGYEVVGVFIKTWHPDFLVCNEEEERLDAMRVAAFLDIPFFTFDLVDVYKKEVADYMIREYKAGRTPNPDVMCNKEVKFGAFLKKALAMGADYVATGHYAKAFSTQNFEGGRFRPKGGVMPRNSAPKTLLVKGVDPSKDQAYFLWTLRQEQLKKIIFPVGNLEKTEVRKLAKKFNLPVAEKKDSQGICFLGAVDLKEFLKHYIKSKKGKVLNENGEEIGYHDGAVFYTLGERHGFTITKKST
ncbi:tRNA 2-thiouridine(34) synthase MnmA [Candidatus Nomurabacteria bacterium]|nr:tRNA 2-thiouridine(34) synthase MnmA [Candidatus Nomurabacteria bacterium]